MCIPVVKDVQTIAGPVFEPKTYHPLWKSSVIWLSEDIYGALGAT